MAATKSNANTSTEPKSDNRLLSEGLMIAFLTVASYAIAYEFEVGYANYFKLPFDLIKISLDMCLRAGVSILLFFNFLNLLLLPFIAFYLKRYENATGITKQVLLFYVVTFVLYWVFRVSLGWGSYSFLYFHLGFGVFVLVLLIAGIIHRHYSDEEKPLSDHVDAVISSKIPDLYSFFDQRLGRQQKLLVYGSIAAFFLTFFVGYNSARIESSFLVTNAGDRILLRSYSDIYIFKSFDKSTNTIGNEVSVMGLDAVSKLDLQKVIVKKPTISDDLDLTKK